MKTKRQLTISLRHCKVPTDKAKMALAKFFEVYEVCPVCSGAGFFDKLRKTSAAPEYTSIYYGDLDSADKLVESSENLSNDFKNIMYRELGIRTTCTNCDGAKFIRRPAEKKLK